MLPTTLGTASFLHTKRFRSTTGQKRELMRVQYTAADIAQQMRVKGVFDPNWLLNPAKVFPLEGRERQ